MGKKNRKRADSEALLDKPRILLPEPGFLSQFLFYAVFLLLGGLGALGSFFTAFQVPLHSGFLLVLGALCCLFCLMLFLGKRRLLLLSLSGALLWLAAVFLFFDDLLQGCLRTLNLVLAAYGEKLNLSLTLFPVEPAGPKAALFSTTAFAALLLLPFFWCLSWLLVRRKSALGAFCLTGLFLLVPMALSILPEFWILALLLLFWIMLLLTSSSLGQRHKLLDERGTYLASGQAAARPATLLLLPAAALCMALIYGLFPLDTYQRPQVVNDIRAGLSDGFGLNAVFKGGVGNGNSSVSLDTLGDRSYTGETALRVKYEWSSKGSNGSTVENRQKDYLKSFVGSVYTGRSWEKLPQEDVQELEALLDGETIQNLTAQYAEMLPLDQRDTQTGYRLSVENQTGNPRCVYTPYGISTSPEELSLLEIEPVADGFFKSSNWFSGVKNYEIDAVGVPPGNLYFDRMFWFWYEEARNALLQGLFQGEFGDFVTEEDLQNGYFTSEQKLQELTTIFSNDLDAQAAAAEGGPENFQRDQWKAPDFIRETLSPDGQALIKAVENYNDFVYEHYTQLPDGLAEFLRGYREEHSLSIPNLAMGREYYSILVKELFDSEFTYSLSPPSVPRGEDFVEYFLTQSKEGFCVHFATAAVALYRSAGIPARYAEGYAVSSWENGRWKDVPDYNAHAWVEVYYSGTGWIPVEVTPSSPDAPATYYNATRPAATPTPSPAPTPSPTPTPAPSSQPESSEMESSAPPSSSSTAESSAESSSAENGSQSSGAGGGGATLWPVLIAVPVALLLVLLLLWGNRRLHRNARRRAFSQRNRNQAALAAYAHLLKLRALDGKNGEPPPEWEALALKAKFSQHMLSPEELRVLTDAAAVLEQKLAYTLPLPVRLRCKYLNGLF